MENANFLVVEDSPTMRQLISFSLKRFKNARIIEAVDGVDALKKLSGPDRIDLILTDINMPVMDGVQFCATLAGRPERDAIAIVVMTAARDAARFREACGADDVLGKPFDLDDLFAVVQQFVKCPPSADP